MCYTENIAQLCRLLPGDVVKVNVPIRYGDVLYWEKKNAYSEGYTKVTTCDEKCINTLILDGNDLDDRIRDYDPVYRDVVKSCKNEVFYTNDVVLKNISVIITQQPTIITFEDGSILITIKVASKAGCDGNNDVVIQWQKRNVLEDEEAPWVSIPGANSEVAPGPYEVGDQYRALLTGKCGQIISQECIIDPRFSVLLTPPDGSTIIGNITFKATVTNEGNVPLSFSSASAELVRINAISSQPNEYFQTNMEIGNSFSWINPVPNLFLQPGNDSTFEFAGQVITNVGNGTVTFKVRMAYKNIFDKEESITNTYQLDA